MKEFFIEDISEESKSKDSFQGSTFQKTSMETNSPQINEASSPEFDNVIQSERKYSLKKFPFFHYSQVEEFDDYIMIGEHRLNKPFVQKPFNADDHNINIYYAQNDGGGCKSLFRKTGNVSSSFDPNVYHIRRDGDYIYEEFLPTDGFDIKVYTVGTDYAHAETRKSPVLDGKVMVNN